MDQSLLELEMLELDERLTRHWLTWTLPLEKRIEMEEHLESIRQKRLKLIRSEIATAFERAVASGPAHDTR